MKAKCDPEVYKNGTPILIVASVDAYLLDGWVQMIARQSGQRIDWNFVGGRAIIKVLGDLDKVRPLMTRYRPVLDAYARAEFSFLEEDDGCNWCWWDDYR